MIAVLQRVNSATVYADEILSGKIGKGLYILLGVERDDSEKDAELLAEKISKLRIFSDENGKMNLSVKDVGGEALVVSNFTLNANYSHGNRPDYFSGAAPEDAERLYNTFLEMLSDKLTVVASGVFGADMRTEMSTDGPVTIVMKSDVLKRGKSAKGADV
ncbi:MAG: D-tyrosyl-tRNA(Tyr) deacylase [Clostridia bacterium]|nr:D-tyrosyl-tRNA(Tyr) deacylase [Clostridia bacterium]